MPKNILVAGGAGYIGSQTVLNLLEEGFRVSVLDDLSTGYIDLVPDGVNLFQGDIADQDLVQTICNQENIQAVIHFAASIEVGESQKNPEKYYFNNVLKSLKFFQALRLSEIKGIVFSSTAAVYGLPKSTPIKEDSELKPINTYGHTKLMMEQILNDYQRSYGLSSICLRYFNASGADSKGRSGESHWPESHLIPKILEVAKNSTGTVKIFGTDYDTKDGTCIRDYIHTQDLASAHVLAVKKILDSETSLHKAINLGTKTGYSIKEVIETAKSVTGVDFPVETVDRRPGDPDVLVADNALAKEYLGWEPVYSNIENIIKTAWEWQEKGDELRKSRH